jgi:hypothetical protein
VGISQLLKGTPRAVPDNFNSRATGIKVLKRVMNHKNKNKNVVYLNMKLIFP